VPVLYRQGKFREILDYVAAEEEATIALLAEVRSMLATFGERKRRR